MRIGVDVGGTNTDAVLMDGRRVLAEHKTPTTPDVTTGIVAALEGLRRTAGFRIEEVGGVMIGTTHFTNAVVERRRLAPTAAIRLGLPATAALPPMVDWPDDLRAALGGHVYLCRGGFEFDGRRIAPLDEDEVRRVADRIGALGIRSVAISSVFSPVNAEMEVRAAEIVAEALPGVAISLSHEIGRVGLLERENATILNASLRELAGRITDALEAAVRGLGIEAPLYISQNDGTLMSVDYCRQYPVATFTSGPTNSMRGAAFLSGEAECVVVDVGGTTTDVGALVHGFPREASLAVHVGGVRTNFRMPDVLSVGLGGGSLVRGGGPELEIGPQSVGYQITERALVFGGDTLTATDLAVAAGLVEIGDAERVRGLDQALVEAGMGLIQSRLADLVDRVKTSAEPLPVVVVGGGSVLVRDDLPGASRVVKPDHFAVANAIGAAIAQVGGETDRIFSLADLPRERALEVAQREAVDRAIAAGAEPGSVQVVEVEEVPLAYLPSNAVRIRVKAVGDLRLGVVDAARA
ncbi:MAG TPA: hydantoinase/oxoprolinase family protein [Candidatus Dormibacteraeota bacterium]|nr:hydantoinase/oxoprolinase family protein [Candidatus Dormibacteraeota bacterium]